MSLCLRDTFGNTFYTSRWLHDGFTTSSSLRIPSASTSYAKLPLRVSFVTASGIIVCSSCVHRVSIGRLRACFGSTLAFYQTRDENRAKLKISYSCGHRVSKSARYDATLRTSSMTLRIPAKVLIHVWSYAFYDMALSTGKQRRHMINVFKLLV